LLTLFVVPTVYTFFAKRKEHVPAKEAGTVPAAPPVTAH
jgi:hypothetical protein